MVRVKRIIGVGINSWDVVLEMALHSLLREHPLSDCTPWRQRDSVRKMRRIGFTRKRDHTSYSLLIEISIMICRSEWWRLLSFWGARLQKHYLEILFTFTASPLPPFWKNVWCQEGREFLSNYFNSNYRRASHSLESTIASLVPLRWSRCFVGGSPCQDETCQ